MEPGEWQAFAVGFAGSMTVEFLLVERSFRRGRGHVAARYKDWLYWAVRVAVAIGAGLLAWTYYVPGLSRTFYLQAGVTMPLLFDQFVHGADPTRD